MIRGLEYFRHIVGKPCPVCGQVWYWYHLPKSCIYCEKAKKTVNSQKSRCRRLGLNEHFSFSEWLDLCKSQDFKCLKCGNGQEGLGPDHIIPLSKGGTNTIDNIQGLCRHCNVTKSTEEIDYRQYLHPND